MSESGLLQRIGEALGLSDEPEADELTYLERVDRLREDLRKSVQAEDPHTALEAALASFRSACPADGFEAIAKAAASELETDSDTLEADMAENDRIKELEDKLEEQGEALAKLADVPDALQKLSESLEKKEEPEAPTAEELKGEVTEIAKSVKDVAESLKTLDERIDSIAAGDTSLDDEGEPIKKSATNTGDELLASIL